MHRKNWDKRGPQLASLNYHELAATTVEECEGQEARYVGSFNKLLLEKLAELKVHKPPGVCTCLLHSCEGDGGEEGFMCERCARGECKRPDLSTVVFVPHVNCPASCAACYAAYKSLTGFIAGKSRRPTFKRSAAFEGSTPLFKNGKTFRVLRRGMVSFYDFDRNII